MYAVLFKTEGHEFDSEQMLDLTGNERHIFRLTEYDNKQTSDEFWQAQSEDFAEHFCQNPCEHVLHDHV